MKICYYSVKFCQNTIRFFYNGPQCGASAPDHLHFQAGSKYTMPLDNEYDFIKSNYGELITDKYDCKIYGINDGLRKIISIEGREEKEIINIFNSFLQGILIQIRFN